MTVRLLLHEPSATPSPRRSWRVLEYLFLFVGLIAIDCYIWVNVEGSMDQSYGNWSLDRQIAGRKPSFKEFLEERLGLSNPPSAEAPTAKAESTPKSAIPRQAPRRLPTFALIGRVEVPRLGLSAIVREGVDSSTLRRAVGHMPSTPLPGQPGNSALAAHRDTLFRKLRDIRKDDRITVQTVDGSYDYVVESLKIVNPEDIGVLKASPGDRLLTLITCYPFNYIGSAPHRFIVRARAVDVSARAARHPIPTKS
jgi:sortase A